MNERMASVHDTRNLFSEQTEREKVLRELVSAAVVVVEEE